MGEPFEHELRVRWAECDPQGVVFNGHYLAYADIGITELWRAAFGSYGTMLERGMDILVGEARLRFLASARFDDLLTLEVGVLSLGTTSIETRHRILRRSELLVEVRMRHVMVDRKTLAKAPIPGWARDGLSPWCVPPALEPAG
jgi:acyl-CoA thioester hydrolase